MKATNFCVGASSNWSSPNWMALASNRPVPTMHMDAPMPITTPEMLYGWCARIGKLKTKDNVSFIIKYKSTIVSPPMRIMKDHLSVRYLVRQASAKWPKRGYTKNINPWRQKMITRAVVTDKLYKYLFRVKKVNCMSRQQMIKTRELCSFMVRSMESWIPVYSTELWW